MCSSQVPGYIEKYDKFKAKGINEIYILTLNDAFVTKCVALSPFCSHSLLPVCINTIYRVSFILLPLRSFFCFCVPFPPYLG